MANVEDGSVSVIDTQDLTEVARIPVGAAPVQVGFTPSGDQVYVSLRDENRMAVIDTASREVMNRIDVGPNPIQMVATPMEPTSMWQTRAPTRSLTTPCP